MGADMFAMNPSAAFDLCQQLGASDRLIEPKTAGRGARIVHRGSLVPIPEGFVLMRATRLWPMIKTPLLSPAGKLRLLLERFKSNNVTEQDQSVAQFVRYRMGDEMLQRIVGPLVAGIYTADIERLSLLATMGPIAKMAAEYGSLTKATLARRKNGDDSAARNSAGARYNQFRAFKNGMREFIDLLAASLPEKVIRTNQPVGKIQREGDAKWSVSVGETSESFDHLVIATPARVSAKLIADVAPTASRHLAEIESASTAIVVLGVQRKDVAKPVDTFGFVVPAIENRKILAVSFASNKFAGRAPDDQLLIRVFIGGAMQSHLLENDDDHLIQIARDELSQLIGLKGQPIMAKVIRWNDAMPQYHVGHLDRVKQIQQDVQSVPGLSLISNALNGVGISPIIGAAKETAKHVRRELAGQGLTA